MRVIVRHVAISVSMGVISVVCLITALLEGDMAQGDKELSAANLAAADRYYSSALGRVSYFDRIPLMFSDARAEIVVNRAAIRYWQGDYVGLLADYPSLQSSMSDDDIRLGLVVAGSAYRVGQHRDVTSSEMLNSLDQAIGMYAQLLESDHRSYDAAFNYEFLIRLREALSGGAEWVPRGLENPLGEEGGSPMDEETQIDDLQIFVPMSVDELDRIDEPTMGSDTPIRRRG
jgi:hypothetical protein